MTKAKVDSVPTANIGKISKHPPVSLFKRFSVLQDGYTNYKLLLCLSLLAHAGDSRKGHNKWQHSQVCKPPPFLGTETQCKLTAQEIAVLEGNKIKTGLSKRSDLSTEKVHSQNGAASMLPHSIRGHKREKTMVPFQHLYNEVPFEITTLNEHSKQSK